MPNRFRSCSIDDLIDALEDAKATYGGDALVAFKADYGDIVHTQQALPMDGNIDELPLEESAYSASGFAVMSDEPDDEDDDEEHQRVLIIT